MSDNNLIRLGGLWLNEAKSGDKYMAGGFGYGGRLLVFKNQFKQKDTDPDYIVYVAPKPEQEEGGSKGAKNDTIPF